jgi:regulator of replication initiation timing
MMNELPQTGLLSSSDVFRINKTAAKVGDVFDEARREARDECMWLSNVCRLLLQDNNRLRIENDALKKRAERPMMSPDGGKNIPL